MQTNSPSLETRLEMHRRMVMTRQLEERLGEMHKAGKTRGPIHRCDGQEAVGVGAALALEDTDYITTTHRGHAVYLGKGLDPRRVIAEIFGRETGYGAGRGGHMLVGDASHGMLGGNAIVGASIPAAAGMALSIQILKQDRVAVAVFGDGAAQTGICHEAMNIAALWKLPVIFLLEHNEYGLTVHHTAQSSVPDLYVRADGYGMPGEKVDGNDASAVYQATTQAVQRARRGDGPSLIEAKTYRLEGFSTSDMGGYQSEEEIAHWKERDPLKVSRDNLLATVEDERVDSLEEEARTALAQAFEEALEDPLPTFTPHAPSEPYRRAASARGQ